MDVFELLKFFKKFLMRIRALTYKERIAEWAERWQESDSENYENE